MALSALKRASKLILLQASLNASIGGLVTGIEQTYEVILGNRSSSKINAMKYVLVEITQVIQECAQFITKYSETKIFCAPLTPIAFMKLIFFTGLWLGKSALNKTTTKVTNYNRTLEQLMQEL
ncbi:hypothetical protein SCLCIDRAFT_28184 [Scleroderma citrinum Foug A]|uniref:Uncharacterized protein n=1 Tax=Scleroderma citrinum Foug A TaxID=1036808 RepID=A0A0C3DC43_9AGAM|nr:hypothetical protein SCLCIDRAFT_28184 [Scleroderma citrinum Foug A]